jgi:hypothetical protein
MGGCERRHLGHGVGEIHDDVRRGAKQSAPKRQLGKGASDGWATRVRVRERRWGDSGWVTDFE